MPNDPIVISPFNSRGYEPVEVEPFTQTAYMSIIPKEKRKFNTSLLESCLTGHFTIRLVDYGNRTAFKEPIVWGPVIGLGESFTVWELLEFPVYILRNHGEYWNELGYTYWLWLFLGAPIVYHLFRRLLKRKHFLQREKWDPREVCYEIAIIGFMAAGLEEFTHLMYAQSSASLGYGFWVGFLVVIILAQGTGILFSILLWNTIYTKNKCLSSRIWAPLEIFTGVSLLLLLGSGFYVGPIAIVSAGAIRFREFNDTQETTEDNEAQRKRTYLPTPHYIDPPRRGYLGEHSNASRMQRSAV